MPSTPTRKENDMRIAAMLALAASLVLTGCTTTTTHKTVERQAGAPKRFWFDYPYNPSPGKRYWTQVSKDAWTEQYEGGVTARFRVVERTTVEDVMGTVVVKISGDPAKTDTGNQGNFQAFIPDIGSKDMQFRYRNLRSNQWDPWRNLAEMKGVE
jgi:hypothetical protein